MVEAIALKRDCNPPFQKPERIMDCYKGHNLSVGVFADFPELEKVFWPESCKLDAVINGLFGNCFK